MTRRKRPRHLRVVRGGQSVRPEVTEWIQRTRRELARMILTAYGTGDGFTGDQLMRCRDALARLHFEFEFDDPNDPERIP